MAAAFTAGPEATYCLIISSPSPRRLSRLLMAAVGLTAAAVRLANG